MKPKKGLTIQSIHFVKCNTTVGERFLSRAAHILFIKFGKTK